MRIRIGRLVAAALLSFSLAGCVIDARSRDTLIEPVRTVDVAVEAGQPIDLRFPAAELTLRNSVDDRVRGELRVLCPDRDSHCARKLADLDFEVSERGDALRVALTHDNSWRFRNSNVEIELAVPSDRSLHLDLTAGAVDAVLSNCMTADVEAGDVQITMPLERVGSVKLDAGVGDAALTIDGRHVSGKRSLLVGAEAHWAGGEGDCRIAIDLQAGDLRLDLDSAGSRPASRYADAGAE